MRIMMSAAGSAVAPSIIKHLQWLGHEVIGHDCNGYGKGLIRSPHVGQGYLSFLQLFEPNFDMYLPFLDEELSLFVGSKPQNCICSPPETLSIFTSKVRQQHALKQAGLPVTSEAEVIIKPDIGRGGRGVIQVGKMPGYVIQRWVYGTEFTIDTLVDRDGKFLFAVPRKRIVAGNVSIVGQIDMHDDMIDLAKDVVSKFSFYGPINIQAILEEKTGEIYIIEVNPRLSGSCIFTVMAGWDILADTIRLFEGRAFIPPEDVQEITIRRHYVETRI